MKDVGIFYGHLVHFMVFSYILLTFGIVHGNLVYYSRFGIFTNKNLATLVPADRIHRSFTTKLYVFVFF
jgi:hypothetical protein